MTDPSTYNGYERRVLPLTCPIVNWVVRSIKEKSSARHKREDFIKLISDVVNPISLFNI